jgi:SAM-dependent methyltransferase
VDRYYIEKFLASNVLLIQGSALEIADSTYTRMFGGNRVTNFEVLHYTDDNPCATIIGDLTKPEDLPSSKVDCFICTQTFNFIFDIQKAIEGAYKLLKPGGVLLATVAGISQISRYDMDRWGDYWRFTTLSARKSFEMIFGVGQVEVEAFGNVLTSIALLEGISANELDESELNFHDENYQLTITIIARKRA